MTKAHFVPHSRAQMSPAAALRQTQTQRTALLAFPQARRSRPQDANPLRAPLTTSQQEAPYPHHYGSVPPFPLLVPNTAASTNHGASSAEPSPLLAVSRVHHFPTVKIQLPIGPLPQAPPSTPSTTTEASEQKGSSF